MAEISKASAKKYPLEEVPDDGVAQLSQVTGEDQVEVRGLVPGVPEEGGKGVVGCRGHGGAHVVGVRNALVHDPAAGDVGDVGAGAVAAQDGAASRSGRPLGGGRPLAAVGHRHPVLPLGGAEVGGGQGGGPVGVAAVDQQGRQAQALSHGGAGTVEPVEGHPEVPQAEGGADTLVQQISGQDIVQVLRRQLRLLQRSLKDRLLHGGLCFLPGLFPEEGVVADLVKKVRQGALALEFPPNIGKGEDGGGMGQGHGLAAQTLVIHDAPPRN